ncbi:hypothetical protein, partial [Streptomyces cinerochromogenes]|uniref:hypothetical protein n=1 Tax=Streptomyces cinerochromogenes TaxID=66422 RepID=UPI0033AEBE83
MAAGSLHGDDIVLLTPTPRASRNGGAELTKKSAMITKDISMKKPFKLAAISATAAVIVSAP